MVLVGGGEKSSMLAAGEVPRSAPDSDAAKAHDLFNLAATATVATMTLAAQISEPWNAHLAATMCAYLVADSVWIALRPEIAGGQSGGGATTLLYHHAAALLISVHAFTWAPHTHYTSWMTVVEINTLIMMIQKQLAPGSPAANAANKAFIGSWVATRILWFPYLSLKLASLPDYPSDLVHVACASSMLGLTVLQLLWTWNFCVDESKQVPLQ